MPSADPHEAWLSSTDLATSANLWYSSLWRKCGEMHWKTDNRNPKGANGPLKDNRGATHRKLYLRSLIWLGVMYPPLWFSTLESEKAMLT